MKTNTEKAKIYVLDNLERAGRSTHITQREHLREAYRKVKLTTSYEELFKALDEVHEKTPHEKAVNKRFPNQRHSIREIYRLLEQYVWSLEDPSIESWYIKEYYNGYPDMIDHEGSESDEIAIEQGNYYR